MASADVAGVYRIYIENPSGTRRLAISGDNSLLGPGGSPDGAIANTPEKWYNVPMSSARGGSGYKLVFTVTAAAAATLDASDASWSIPVTVNNQQQTVGNSAGNGLGNDNFVVDLALGDIALVADRETVGAVYRAKEGVTFHVGPGPIFYVFEDNTA